MSSIYKGNNFFSPIEYAYKKKYGEFPDMHIYTLINAYGKEKAYKIRQSNISAVNRELKEKHNRDFEKEQLILEKECPFN
jgi:hypothetical protein